MIRVLRIMLGSFIIAHHHAAKIVKKRVPKFEFYVYNDLGNLVKQYLTSEQIQELLRGQGQPAGEEQIKYLLGKNSDEIPMPNLALKKDIEDTLPLVVPTVSHDDSPDLRRVMAKVWTLIRKAERDRTSTTTTSTTTSTTTRPTTTQPVELVEMDEKLTQHNLIDLIEEKEMLCLKFAKKCIKLGKQETP